MNKKVILALLALLMACCVCFVAAGIAFYFFYAEDISSNSTSIQNEVQSSASTAIPTAIIADSPENNVVPTNESQSDIGDQLAYMTNLSNDLNTCLVIYTEWKNINDQFAADDSLIENNEFVEEYKLVLMQMKDNCTSFGVEGNPPPEYETINDNALMVNESTIAFVDAFLLYFETKVYEDGLTGVNAAFEMQDNMEQLVISITEIANKE